MASISPGLHISVLRDVTDRHHLDKQRARILDALRRLSPGNEPEETANDICAEIVDNGDFASAAIYAFDIEVGRTALGARFRGRSRSPGPRRALGTTSRRRCRRGPPSGPWVDEWSGPGDERARAAMTALGIPALVLRPDRVGRPPDRRARGRRRRERRGALAAGPRVGRVRGPGGIAARPGSAASVGTGRPSEPGSARSSPQRAFSSVFQPIVDMTSGAVLGYEALTRFVDGTPPDAAFQAAATAGVGLELEAATIESALEASALLPIGPLPGHQRLAGPGDGRGAPRRAVGRSSSNVVLEITEHVSVHDYGELRQAIATLGKDVRFSVDDAGAGFASMRHILELAPTQVKLDRALVARIDADRRDRRWSRASSTSPRRST